jgi:hypothetical protein
LGDAAGKSVVGVFEVLLDVCGRDNRPLLFGSNQLGEVVRDKGSHLAGRLRLLLVLQAADVGRWTGTTGDLGARHHLLRKPDRLGRLDRCRSRGSGDPEEIGDVGDDVATASIAEWLERIRHRLDRRQLLDDVPFGLIGHGHPPIIGVRLPQTQSY